MKAVEILGEDGLEPHDAPPKSSPSETPAAGGGPSGDPVSAALGSGGDQTWTSLLPQLVPFTFATGSSSEDSDEDSSLAAAFALAFA